MLSDQNCFNSLSRADKLLKQLSHAPEHLFTGLKPGVNEMASFAVDPPLKPGKSGRKRPDLRVRVGVKPISKCWMELN